MKERPILFSAPMVRALLDGSKTQTRRALKVQSPHWKRVVHVLVARLAAVISCKQPVDTAWVGFDVGSPSGPHYYKCPYGQPGDRLWVREAWGACSYFDKTSPKNLPRFAAIKYLADGETIGATAGYGLINKSRPSIHMPRWVSRITLEITNVRVERLQDISRGDAMEEGCPFPNMAQGDDPRKWYADLWNSINGPGSWDLNPWVWVVEFKRVQP